MIRNSPQLSCWPMLCLLLALLAGPAAATQPATHLPPPAPCDSMPYPAWPETGGELHIAFWKQEDVPPDWQPPVCSGWRPAEFAILMAATGRMTAPQGVEDLLSRVGAVSTLAGLRYWSVTRDAWHTLISEAHALGGPDRADRRSDFAANELVPGRDHYYWQQEPSTSGSAVYRLRVLERSADRLVVSVDNAAPSRWLGIPMLDTGKAQTLYLLQQLEGGQWGYFQLTRIGHGPHDWLPVTRASYANRAIAIFRWFAGLPEDALPVWRD
jgi:hypothetical protein